MTLKKITILTIFPQMISQALEFGILKRLKHSICVDVIDIYKLTDCKRIDDYCVSYSPGMLFRADASAQAIDSVKESKNSYVIHMSPRGKLLTMEKVRELTDRSHLIIFLSRYEGVDERLLQTRIDEEISIGDYVLSGGELPALVLIDAISRMFEKVLQSSALEEESFNDGLLEYPHYTKPNIFEGQAIPSWLLTGNHNLIKEKRWIQRLGVTWACRPDLLREYNIFHNKISSTNLLTRIKKQNNLFKKRIYMLEKAIQEYQNGRRKRIRRSNK